MIKSDFYRMYGAGFNTLCIGSERDPRKHSQMKKNLSNAFSTKALMEQEQLVGKLIDAFIHRIGKDGGPATDGLNMTKWYEMVAFDILGEMAFGESFGCIETGKPHFWADLILEHLYFITLADNLRRIPVVTTLVTWLFPSTVATRSRNSEFSRQQVARYFIYQCAKDWRTDDMSKTPRKCFATKGFHDRTRWTDEERCHREGGSDRSCINIGVSLSLISLTAGRLRGEC